MCSSAPRPPQGRGPRPCRCGPCGPAQCTTVAPRLEATPRCGGDRVRAVGEVAVGSGWPSSRRRAAQPLPGPPPSAREDQDVLDGDLHLVVPEERVAVVGQLGSRQRAAPRRGTRRRCAGRRRPSRRTSTGGGCHRGEVLEVVRAQEAATADARRRRSARPPTSRMLTTPSRSAADAAHAKTLRCPPASTWPVPESRRAGPPRSATTRSFRPLPRFWRLARPVGHRSAAWPVQAAGSG